MTKEKECLKCKWCNYNQISWWKLIYYTIDPTSRLYLQCTNPQVFWTHDDVKQYHLCMTARADHKDTETITWCGTIPKYFESK